MYVRNGGVEYAFEGSNQGFERCLHFVILDLQLLHGGVLIRYTLLVELGIQAAPESALPSQEYNLLPKLDAQVQLSEFETNYCPTPPSVTLKL